MGYKFAIVRKYYFFPLNWSLWLIIVSLYFTVQSELQVYMMHFWEKMQICEIKIHNYIIFRFLFRGGNGTVSPKIQSSTTVFSLEQWCWKFSLAITGIHYCIKYAKTEQSFKNGHNISLLYFWSNKCGLGAHLRRLKVVSTVNTQYFICWRKLELYSLVLTLEHKTSKFFKTEIYASSESWINNISIDVWFGQYL